MKFNLEDKFIKSILQLLENGASYKGDNNWLSRFAVIDGPLDRIRIYSDDYLGFISIDIIYLSKIVFQCSIEKGEVNTHKLENGHWANTVVRKYKAL